MPRWATLTPNVRAAAERAVASRSPVLRRAYLRAITVLQGQLDERRVLRLLKAGDIDSVVTPGMVQRAIGTFDAKTQEAMRDAWERTRARASQAASAAGGSTRGATPPVPPLGVAFNMRNDAAVRALDRLDAQFLRGVRADMREGVRAAIQDGLARGRPLAAVARDIRQSVGLAPNMVRYVGNYREELETAHLGAADPLKRKRRDRRFDATLRKAARTGVPLTEAQIDKMTDAYRRRIVAMHADTIARTVSLNALREGQRASIEAMIAENSVGRNEVRKRWVTVGDARVRPEHVRLQGEIRRMDEAFSNGLDTPNEWNCRCVVDYELDVDTWRDASRRQAGEQAVSRTWRVERDRSARLTRTSPPPPPPPAPAPPPPPPTPTPVTTRVAAPEPGADAFDPRVSQVASHEVVYDRLAQAATPEETAWAEALLDRLTKRAVGPDDFGKELRAGLTDAVAQPSPLDVLRDVGALPVLGGQQGAERVERFVNDVFGGFKPTPYKLLLGEQGYHSYWYGLTRSVTLGTQSGRDVYAHELVHMFENGNPLIGRWGLERLQQIAGTTEPVLICRWAPGQTIRGFESPNLLRDYQGRIYPDDRRHTEYVSVAVQELWRLVSGETTWTESGYSRNRDMRTQLRDLLVFFRRANDNRTFRP